jgi:hypothetical protein
VALACAGCHYPRDIGGTADTVRKNGTIRIGLAPSEQSEDAAARRFVSALERATDARARFERAPAEALLARLETGDLDLVLGDFAEDSPWLDDAALIEPLSRRIVGERVIGLAPVARNGENAWIGLVERTVRDNGGAS